LVTENLLKYHESIVRELNARKDRVRNLIGDAHWLSDGEYKEAVLRSILQNHIPESISVGRGFVRTQMGLTTQLDILLTSKRQPTLFKDGDFFIVTQDTPVSIVEVKTRQDKEQVRTAIFTLSDQIEKIREYNKGCKCGLFIYDSYPRQSYEKILEALHDAAHSIPERVVDWVSVGQDHFIRYWERSGDEWVTLGTDPAWHLYKIEGLAPAYFISNVVWEASEDASILAQTAWFPIEGGKSRFRKKRIKLIDRNILRD